MTDNNFKVIVVGGGPVGLTAAHALYKAGIDFLVLERRPAPVIDAGSNLVLSPVGIRVLSQLGLNHALTSVSTPLGRIDRLDHRGRDIGDSEIFLQIEKSFGSALRVISRHDLTKILYDSLPHEAQQKILCNKQLSNITATPNGVLVTCADGSSYAATTLIGADGAHSSVRQSMRALALNAGASNVNDETPFLTTYRALWIRFPQMAGLSVGATSETHGRDAATQLFIGEDSGVVALYERLERPTTERIRHTQADRDSCIGRWGHLPVMPGTRLTLRDLYTSQLESGLVSLEEGVVPHWSWDGRIVLAGDSAHKYTPSTGQGCNTGMIDIVVLVNELNALLQSTQAPTREQIGSAFRSYQDARREVVTSECATSSQATRMATWQTGIHKFIDRRVFSLHTVQRFVISSGAKSAARTPAFKFISSQGTDLQGTDRVASTPVSVAAA